MSTLTVEQVEQLETATRAGLSDAIGNLTRLREGGAHSLRGFPSWHAYVLDRFGDLLRHLDLPKPERQAFVASATAAGQSVREVAEKLSVSKSTVGNDVQELASVTRLDDRRPAEPSPVAAGDASRGTSETTAPEPSSVDLVVAAVARSRDGLMVHEVARRLRWRQGQASCALSRAEKRGRLVRTGRFRDGCAVYDRPAAAAALTA